MDYHICFKDWGTFITKLSLKFEQVHFWVENSVDLHQTLQCSELNIATDQALFFIWKNADIFRISPQKHVVGTY